MPREIITAHDFAVHIYEAEVEGAAPAVAIECRRCHLTMSYQGGLVQNLVSACKTPAPLPRGTVPRHWKGEAQQLAEHRIILDDMRKAMYRGILEDHVRAVSIAQAEGGYLDDLAGVMTVMARMGWPTEDDARASGIPYTGPHETLSGAALWLESDDHLRGRIYEEVRHGL